MCDTEPRAKTEVTPPERLVAGAGGRLRRRRSTWLRGGRLNAGGAQGAIDHHPQLCLRQSAGNSLAVDKHGRRALQAQRLRFLGRRAHLGLILLGKAGVQLARVELAQNGLLAGNAVERREALLDVAVLPPLTSWPWECR